MTKSELLVILGLAIMMATSVWAVMTPGFIVPAMVWIGGYGVALLMWRYAGKLERKGNGK
jgi:hypothetical protein